MDLTKRIVTRDEFRTGANYFKALRGYQRREDILDAMYKSLDIKSLEKEGPVNSIDLGCGPGTVGEYFYNKLRQVVKIHEFFLDINPSMLSSISIRADYTIVEGDVTKLKFRSGYFDIATMKQVLDYLPKALQYKALRETYRILKNNGQFVLSALVSPSENAFDLTNLLYSEREKVLNPSTPIQKFIPPREIYSEWLEKIGFSDVSTRYVYEIPLTVKDFVSAFGLSEAQRKNLMKLYREVVTMDTTDEFKARKVSGDIELIEKAVVISSLKHL
ncbi:MAG: methyltransferase domain-containing protein [Candidatus Aenigmarchaeota archaeon]|nr:methyltransferase domain-containing protein [Candidatus Aenigmarchaeota archaeon]